ncbi:unnamed protein product, partial [marine sediment metagenome]
MRKFVTITAVLAMTALAANAAITYDFSFVGTKVLTASTVNVYDLVVTVTGTYVDANFDTKPSDWTNAVLDIDLATGSFYLDAMGGGGTEPNPLFFPAFPDLEWDTYAAVPAGHPSLASFAGT